MVIDTAPVLAASETFAFSSLADATMVCVMRDASRQDHLKRCLNRLEASGVERRWYRLQWCLYRTVLLPLRRLPLYLSSVDEVIRLCSRIFFFHSNGTQSPPA